jgi:3-phenylpropionate/trans-cinnamate dioxygenase ferredoxin component
VAFVRVGSVSALQPGWVIEAKVGENYYAVCNAGGQIHCLDGECPCTGGPLSQGALRNDLLVCPWHGWRFDYRDGVCAYDDSIKIAKFPVRIEGDDILIDVSQPISQPS